MYKKVLFIMAITIMITSLSGCYKKQPLPNNDAVETDKISEETEAQNLNEEKVVSNKINNHTVETDKVSEEVEPEISSENKINNTILSEQQDDITIILNNEILDLEHMPIEIVDGRVFISIEFVPKFFNKEYMPINSYVAKDEFLKKTYGYMDDEWLIIGDTFIHKAGEDYINYVTYYSDFLSQSDLLNTDSNISRAIKMGGNSYYSNNQLMVGLKALAIGFRYEYQWDIENKTVILREWNLDRERINNNKPFQLDRVDFGIATWYNENDEDYINRNNAIVASEIFLTFERIEYGLGIEFVSNYISDEYMKDLEEDYDPDPKGRLSVDDYETYEEAMEYHEPYYTSLEDDSIVYPGNDDGYYLREIFTEGSAEPTAMIFKIDPDGKFDYLGLSWGGDEYYELYRDIRGDLK